MVSMDDVPENVRDEVEEVIMEDECVFCKKPFLDVVKKDGDRYYISKYDGEVKGDFNGGIPLLDQGAVPRQVIDTEPQMACGHCYDTDIIERNSTDLWGVDAMSEKRIGAFTYNGFLDFHYLSDSNFDTSIFEEAFESLAREHPDTIEVDGITLKRSTGELAEEVRNVLGKRPAKRDNVGEKLIEILDDHVDRDKMIVVTAGTRGVFLPEEAL